MCLAGCGFGRVSVILFFYGSYRVMELTQHFFTWTLLLRKYEQEQEMCCQVLLNSEMRNFISETRPHIKWKCSSVTFHLDRFSKSFTFLCNDMFETVLITFFQFSEALFLINWSWMVLQSFLTFHCNLLFGNLVFFARHASIGYAFIINCVSL